MPVLATFEVEGDPDEPLRLYDETLPEAPPAHRFGRSPTTAT